MEYFQWDENLSVNVQEIDEQHKTIVKLVGGTSLEEESASLSTDDFLKTMLNYAGIHFTTEENYMRSVNFSGYDEHKKQHEFFVTATLENHRKCQGPNPPQYNETVKFYRTWWQKHIVNFDKQYTKALNDAGVF